MCPCLQVGFTSKSNLVKSLSSQLVHFLILTSTSNFKGKVMNLRLYLGQKTGGGGWAPITQRGFTSKSNFVKSLSSQLEHLLILTSTSNFKSKVMNPRFCFGQKWGGAPTHPVGFYLKIDFCQEFVIPIGAFLNLNINL